MIVNAAREGLQIAEVPAPYNVRLGESKLNTVRDGWRHLRFLLISAPNFLFVLPGLALLGHGPGRHRDLVPGRRRHRDRVAGLATGLRGLDPHLDRRQRAGLRARSRRRTAWTAGSSRRTPGSASIDASSAWSGCSPSAASCSSPGSCSTSGCSRSGPAGSKLPLGLQLAALAQSLMIVGANTGHGRLPGDGHRRSPLAACVTDPRGPDPGCASPSSRTRWSRTASGGAERRVHELAIAPRRTARGPLRHVELLGRRADDRARRGDAATASGRPRPFYGADGRRTLREGVAFAARLPRALAAAARRRRRRLCHAVPAASTAPGSGRDCRERRWSRRGTSTGASTGSEYLRRAARSWRARPGSANGCARRSRIGGSPSQPFTAAPDRGTADGGANRRWSANGVDAAALCHAATRLAQRSRRDVRRTADRREGRRPFCSAPWPRSRETCRASAA